MSYGQWRTCAWTFYGRYPTVSILYRYMAREHATGFLDEWMLCVNTIVAEDIAYAEQLAAGHDWIRLQYADRRCDSSDVARRNSFLHQFYRYTTDPGVLYFRLDDDVVYVHPQALHRLAAAATGWDGIAAAFPVTITNAVMSWYLQQAGKIPRDFGVVERPGAMTPVGWSDPRFAEGLHEYVLGHLEAGTPEDLFLDGPVTLSPQHLSVSSYALPGSRLAGRDDALRVEGMDEERWMTETFPSVAGGANMIVNDALVCHYSFYPTFAHLNTTPILGRYRALAEAAA